MIKIFLTAILILMLWGILRIFLISINLITDTFLAFFIWQQEQSLNPVLYYGLAFFSAIPIASLIAGYTCEHLQPKTAMLIGIWIRIIQLFTIILLKDNLDLLNIIIIAILGGLSEGFTNISARVIENDHGIEEYESYFATNTVFKEILILLIPLGGAVYLNYTNDYPKLFMATIIFLIITAFLFAVLRANHIHSSFDLKSILTFPGTNKDKKYLVYGSFLEGISQGITLTVLPILLLYLSGNILNWGFINTFMVIIALLLSFIIKRIVDTKNSKYLYATGAFLFAVVSVFFITDYGLMLLVIFLIAKTIMDVIKEVSFNSSMQEIVEEDRDKFNLFAEYEFLSEAAINAGRIVPILIMIVFTLNIKDDLVLKLILILVGIMPIITLSILGRSKLFSDGEELTDQL